MAEITLDIAQVNGGIDNRNNWTFNAGGSQARTSPIFAPINEQQWNAIDFTQYEVTNIYYTLDQSAREGVYYWLMAAGQQTKAELPGRVIEGQAQTDSHTIVVPSEYWNDPFPQNPKNSQLAVTFRADGKQSYESVTQKKILTNIVLHVEYEIKAQAITSEAIQADTVDIGSVQTVTITNNPNNHSLVKYRVKLTYGSVQSGWLYIGSQSGQYSTTSWAVPTGQINTVCGLCAQNSKLASGTITVETYLDDNYQVKLGEATKGVQLQMNSTQGAPTIAVVTEDATPTQQKPGQYAGYIQGFSVLKITSTITNKYGATTGSISVSTQFGTYTPTSGHNYIEIPIKTSGSFPYVVTATDSRDFESSYGGSVNVDPYVIPVFKNVVCYKTTSSSSTVEDDEGEYLYFNSTVLKDPRASETDGKIEISIKDLSQNTTTTLTSLDISYDENNIGTATGNRGTIQKEKTYIITLTMTDSNSKTSTYLITILPALYTIHRQSGGRGVAFGKISELYGVEINKDWPFYTHDKEIMELILDCAHPVGSIFSTIDSSFNPNVVWPWSLWGKLSSDTISTSPQLTENVWIRAR